MVLISVDCDSGKINIVECEHNISRIANVLTTSKPNTLCFFAVIEFKIEKLKYYCLAIFISFIMPRKIPQNSINVPKVSIKLPFGQCCILNIAPTIVTAIPINKIINGTNNCFSFMLK